MSQSTSFMKLPNEIVYHIFDFLNSFDILLSFAHLNYHYDNLIKSYIKSLDLTKGWTGNQQDLQWLCSTVQILKIDRFYFYLLDNCSFLQLQSLLNIGDISEYDEWISKMNLKSLTIWSDDSSPYHDTNIVISESVVRFSTNLRINLPVIDNLEPLNKLNSFSLSAKYGKGMEKNIDLPFNDIEFFIDNYCLNKNILKRITLQLNFITFDEHFWSAIERYKNMYDHFDFYGIFQDENEITENILNDTHFVYHIERRKIYYTLNNIHIYSLPFRINKLYGFKSCSELNFSVSSSSVRRLYFSGTYEISFESLIKRMSNLTSINCYVGTNDCCDRNVKEIFVDKDIFYHVRSLYFKMGCDSDTCRCRKILDCLLHQMPYLECLNTSEMEFLYGNRSLPPIKQLIRQYCDLKLVDLLLGMTHLYFITVLWPPVRSDPQPTESEVIPSPGIR
ncbi:hypothetical protein I4U23_016110 [Adineta vaga]|nr:hypothetical protein I4U23_016110 [Adineta vaga]